MAFTSRIRCYNAWQNAENDLKRTKQVHEKARSQGRISQDRIGLSMGQVADVSYKHLSLCFEFLFTSSHYLY